jgi:putative RNA 2'-phosphotransferase
VDDARRIAISKFVSYALRHGADELDLELATGGWAEVEAVLAIAGQRLGPVSRRDLELVVRRCDKQRFGFDDGLERIRAHQGHSLTVPLELEPQSPPALLFHGTHRRVLDAILKQGLLRGSRQFVHLSVDEDTARRVGARRGAPVLVRVDAARMHRDGHVFHRADNGVWLTEAVPSSYLDPEAKRA